MPRGKPERMTPVLQARNRLGSMVLMKLPEAEITKQRVLLATLKLEVQLREALAVGVTPGRIAYLAKKLSA